MPSRSNDRGTLVLDLRFKGVVGRLKRATGTQDERVLDRYRQMCRDLYDGGRVDILLALKQRRVTFAEVWEVFRPMQGKPAAALAALPSPETVRRLWARDGEDPEAGAFLAWLGDTDVSATHRDNLLRDILAFRRLAAPKGGGVPSATVNDLPELVRTARTVYLKQQKRRAFNMLRTTAQAFLKATVGKRHPLYLAVGDVAALDERRKRTSGLSPADARAVRAALGPAYGQVWWALCTTGMRPAEYWAEGEASWRLAADRVAVWASKTDTGRELPLVDRSVLLTPPPRTRRGTETELADLVRGEGKYARPWPRNVTLYDGRRTFRHWCEMAGIPRSRAMYYRSAKPRDVDDLYAMHEVTTAHRAEDAAKLRAYLDLTDDGPAVRLVADA